MLYPIIIYKRGECLVLWVILAHKAHWYDIGVISLNHFFEKIQFGELPKDKGSHNNNYIRTIGGIFYEHLRAKNVRSWNQATFPCTLVGRIECQTSKRYLTSCRTQYSNMLSSSYVFSPIESSIWDNLLSIYPNITGNSYARAIDITSPIMRFIQSVSRAKEPTNHTYKYMSRSIAFIDTQTYNLHEGLSFLPPNVHS